MSSKPTAPAPIRTYKARVRIHRPSGVKVFRTIHADADTPQLAKQRMTATMFYVWGPDFQFITQPKPL